MVGDGDLSEIKMIGDFHGFWKNENNERNKVILKMWDTSQISG